MNDIKKWIVLFSGLVIQMVLGGVYAWSVFAPSLVRDYNLLNSSVGFIFGFIIATFTFSMIIGGRLLEKFGPRITSVIGVLLFSAGYVLASFSDGNYYHILISLGIVSGIGIGFGYVCPLTVGMKWFPKHKGLITGVSVAGFGGGAILLSYIANMMFEKGLNVMEIFFNIGIYLGGVAFLCALLMSEPKEDENTVHKPKECLKKYLFTKTFILFCVGIFAGTFAGLMLVGNLKPVMLSVGLNDMYATLSISIFALGNIIGRTIWGEIHDLLGSRKTILISLLFLGLSLPLLLINTLPEILLFIVLLVGIGFGGCFVIYASSVVNNYGIDLFPRLYPFCFLCYGIAGLKGPAIGGYIHELIGSYSYGILLSSVIVLLVFLLFFFKFEEVENA